MESKLPIPDFGSKGYALYNKILKKSMSKLCYNECNFENFTKIYHSDYIIHYDIYSASFNFNDVKDFVASRFDSNAETINTLSGASKASSLKRDNSDSNYSLLYCSENNSTLEINSKIKEMFKLTYGFEFISTINPNHNYFHIKANDQSYCYKSYRRVIEKKLGHYTLRNTSSEIKNAEQIYCDKCCDCNRFLLVPCKHDLKFSKNGSNLSFNNYNDGSKFYRKYFYGSPHTNFLMNHKIYGPIIISIIKSAQQHNGSPMKSSNPETFNGSNTFRIILRTLSENVLKVSIRENLFYGIRLKKKPIIQHILSKYTDNISLKDFKKISNYTDIQDSLLQLDEISMTNKHKIGVILCKENQKTENDFYSNQNTTPELTEFMSLIAEKVNLNGFQGYSGGLCTGNKNENFFSYYKKYFDREIMFHVSTMLPFSVDDPQQISKKCHIGNNKISIIFQDSNCEPFDISVFRSKFLHIFIVVRLISVSSDNVPQYHIGVCKSSCIMWPGLNLPNRPISGDQNFGNFMLNLIIEADIAADRCEKLRNMARNTRYNILTEIINHNNIKVSYSKMPKIYWKRSTAVNFNSIMIPLNNIELAGGLSYKIEVSCNEFYIGGKLLISSKCIVLISYNHSIHYNIPTCCLRCWDMDESNRIKLYVGYMKYFEFTLIDSSPQEIDSLFTCLKLFTNGFELKTIFWAFETKSFIEYFNIGPMGIVLSVDETNNTKEDYKGLVGSHIFNINGSIQFPSVKFSMNDFLKNMKIVSFKIFPSHAKYDKLNRSRLNSSATMHSKRRDNKILINLREDLIKKINLCNQNRNSDLFGDEI